ncbi:MAG TPA: hypothetical protein PKC76_03820 [Saprospiraceae bacterium]|nr:hypothetical protein [Saprospiraceae bacterium]HMP23230.1 hypothetical protein [Saprospiraceae bacterium]
MKNKTLASRLSATVLALVTLALLSSCNRGVGCPTNFSTDIFDALYQVLQILF